MKLLITTQVIDKNDPILGFFHRWVEEFAVHFEHIYVICLKEGEHTLPSNVTVYSLGKEDGESRLKYTWRFYTYFTNIFFQEKVDFVFFHMGAIYNIMAAPYFFFRKIYGTKFYWWKTHGLLNTLGKVAFRFVDKVFTAGEKSFPISSKKINVVGHAIDTSQFSFVTNKGISEGVIKVISVGRVVPIKKIECAFEAVKNVRDVHVPISLSVYGPISDAQYKKRLDHIIYKYNLDGIVSFAGPVEHGELPLIYAQYDVLIHPAYEAGFDKVVLEAMAVGVIPVTSIQSFKSILEPYGLYIPPNDSIGYTNIISKIAHMSKIEREKLSSALRNIVVEGHSITTLSQRIFNT